MSTQYREDALSLVLETLSIVISVSVTIQFVVLIIYIRGCMHNFHGYFSSHKILVRTGSTIRFIPSEYHVICLRKCLPFSSEKNSSRTSP